MPRIRRKPQTPITTRAHGCDFAVGSQAAQPDQNADQHAGRYRDRESEGQAEADDFQHAAHGCAVAHHQFEDAGRILGEDNECEDCGPDQRMSADFAQNIACENPHLRADSWSLACALAR